MTLAMCEQALLSHIAIILLTIGRELLIISARSSWLSSGMIKAPRLPLTPHGGEVLKHHLQPSRRPESSAQANLLNYLKRNLSQSSSSEAQTVGRMS
jgi:hypothetical protein